MKKIAGIIGHFGHGHNCYDGQTVKTKAVTSELERYFGNDKLVKYDTHGKLTAIIKAPGYSFYSLYKTKNTVILLGENGLRVYVPLLALFHILFRNRKIHYVVIGGWLPQYVVKHRLLSKLLKKLDAIYVETVAMKDALAKLGFSNVYLMPNFKRLTMLTKDELVYNYTYPLKLCTFSRVMKEKGIEEAVKAVDEVNKAAGKELYSLDIYGQVDVNQGEWFEELINSFPKSIRYLGVVPFGNSVEVLKNYFALLFPTYYEGEGFAGTLIDAMSAGVPAIASNWKYNSEIVIDGKTGYLFNTHATDELKEILVRVAETPENLNSLKQDCLEYATDYQPEKAIRVLIEKMT